MQNESSSPTWLEPNTPWMHYALPDHWQQGIVLICANYPGRGFDIVGTGFIAARNKDEAAMVTAKHVIEEIQRVQQRPSAAHPSALREFLPAPDPLNIDLEAVFAQCYFGTGCLGVRLIDDVFVHADADVGICRLTKQFHKAGMSPAERDDVPLDVGAENDFQTAFLIADLLPEVDSTVGVLCFTKMGMDRHAHVEEEHSYEITTNPTLRLGRVTAVYPEGQGLSRGPCFETTIPFIGGMSGAPVVTWGQRGALKVIGVVCSDLDNLDSDPYDTSTAGCSRVAKLPMEVEQLGPASTKAMIARLQRA